jgi:hypothetical protein
MPAQLQLRSRRCDHHPQFVVRTHALLRQGLPCI